MAMSNLFRSSRNRSTPGSKSATVGADDRAVCRIETGKGEGEGRGVEGRGGGGREMGRREGERRGERKGGEG